MATSPALRPIDRAYSRLINVSRIFQGLFLLVIRLYWGWQFFQAGKGKLQNIGQVVEFFQSLNIPYPLLGAYAAAVTECVGGLCLLLGFASRLAAIPLTVTMVVAYATAHRAALAGILQDPETFVTQAPFPFLMVSLIILLFGPGLFSIDGIIKGFVLKRKDITIQT